MNDPSDGKVALAVEAPGAPPAPRMAWIPGGTFRMGSDHHYREEAPAHQVAVKGFWIDHCAVTNKALMNHPVVHVGSRTPDRTGPQAGRPLAFGALVNHIWGVGGDSDRADISSTFLQPFVSHTTPTASTYSLNAEATYDWKNNQWAVPINATVAKLLKIGHQPVSLGGGLRYWATGPDSGPHGWGYRLIVTFLFPR